MNFKNVTAAEHNRGAHHLVCCFRLQRCLNGEQQGDYPPVAILRGKVCDGAPLVAVTLRGESKQPAGADQP